MSGYPFFIPGFVLCTNSSLFWFKIANKLSEFRNYLICIAFTKNKRNYDGQYSCHQKNPENILYPLMLYIILSYIFHPKFSSSSYSRYSLYHLSLFCTIILSPNGRGLTPFRFNVTIYRYIICRYIKLLSYTNQRRPE